MIADVLGHSSGSVVMAIIIMFVCIAAFIGVIIWSVRLRNADVDEMSRIPLDDEKSISKGGAIDGQVQR